MKLLGEIAIQQEETGQCSSRGCRSKTRRGPVISQLFLWHHSSCTTYPVSEGGTHGRGGRGGLGELIFFLYLFIFCERNEEEGLCHIGEALYFSAWRIAVRYLLTLWKEKLEADASVTSFLSHERAPLHKTALIFPRPAPHTPFVLSFDTQSRRIRLHVLVMVHPPRPQTFGQHDRRLKKKGTLFVSLVDWLETSCLKPVVFLNHST